MFSPFQYKGRKQLTLPQHEASIGPKKSDVKKRVTRTTAFQSSGPSEIIAMRSNALCCGVSSDLTKLYDTMATTAPTSGPKSSDTMTVLMLARGTSTDSFSDGTPRRFFLKPVMRVRLSRQYPIHELACDFEFPRDSQRSHSR